MSKGYVYNSKPGSLMVEWLAFGNFLLVFGDIHEIRQQSFYDRVLGGQKNTKCFINLVLGCVTRLLCDI